MDRYLHFNSHHPVSAKRAAIRSLFDRVRNVTLWNENLQRRRSTPRLLSNKMVTPYLSLIHSISSSIQATSTSPLEEEPGEPGHQEEEKQPLAVIAYVSGVSEWIRKACEKYNLKGVFKSGPTFHSLLMH